MNKEIRVVGFIAGVLAVLGCYLLLQNTLELRDVNKLEIEEQEDRFRQEYERVLLGCNTSGALESSDPWLRELCDEQLPKMRDRVVLISTD